MTEITQRELRNDNAKVVDRVEAGESFTVTRRGRPVADLVPHRARIDVSYFVDSVEVVAAFASAPAIDGGAWLRDSRVVDELVDDGDRDPWSTNA